LTLSVLVALTVPMLALLSVSALEPLIARNLVDATRALYVAEAGIEWALTLLVDTPDPDVVFLGAAGGPAGAPPPPNSPGPGGVASLASPPGLLPWGTTLITARGDPGVVSDDTSGATHGLVILTSTGTVNGAQRTIEVTVRRVPPNPSGGGAGSGPLSQHRIVNWRER
ncbi:MAG: hypothetical protein ACREJV_06655, partial [Candidatus Rokuibacteriota bacterium]